MPSHCAGLLQARCTYASYPDTLKERKKAEKHVLLPRPSAVVHSNVIASAHSVRSLARALVSAPFQSVPLAREKKGASRSFRYFRENNTWSRGGRFFFSTPHVEFFNFDPPDREGGGYLIPPPPLNATLIPIYNRTQGTVESRPNPLL